MEEKIDENSLRLLQRAVESFSKRVDENADASMPHREVQETLRRVIGLLTLSGANPRAEDADLHLLETVRSELINMGPRSEPEDSAAILGLLYHVQCAHDAAHRI